MSSLQNQNHHLLAALDALKNSNEMNILHVAAKYILNKFFKDPTF